MLGEDKTALLHENIPETDKTTELFPRITNTEPWITKSKANKFEFQIDVYDYQCEENSKISSIISLTITPLGMLFFTFLNIITIGWINLFVMWYPTIQLSILYSKTEIQNASYIGVYCHDNTFHIIKLIKLELPNLTGSPLKSLTLTNLPQGQSVIMFTFKWFKYVFDANTNSFHCWIFNFNSKNENIHKFLSAGWTEIEVKHQKEVYGQCDLNIEISSFLKLLFIEFSDPFYLFQVFSFILWINNNYIAYAYVILAATILSLFIGVFETRSNLVNVQEMAKYECKINALRSKNNNSTLKHISSKELVPGDVFELPEDGMVMPCDAILIQGSAIINEAMLTGESTPIFKSQLPINSNDFSKEKMGKYIIYAGTKIIQKRDPNGKCQRENNMKNNWIHNNNNNNNCNLHAIVLNTNFSTTKGNLIRSIWFPKNEDSKFKKDSVRYIIWMGVISWVGFIISLPFLIKSGMQNVEIIKRSLDLVTTTVPPALPACWGIGISLALARWKIHRIICVNRDRVNIAGKVNMICFDKTGTLTEDHLDIGGYLPVYFSVNKKILFDNYVSDLKINSERAFYHYISKITNDVHNKNYDLNQWYIECLACCHSITKVNERLLGDPIDVKMFEATKWTLTESTSDELITTYVRPGQEKDLEEKWTEDNIDDEEKIISSHYEIGWVKCFDFSSNLQRMSVLVKNSNENYFKVFTKGSPEKIKELCKPESLPENFDDMLNSYTLKGNRVLALACKQLKMDFIQSQRISRDKIESNLIFLGLLIVHNKLKEKTRSSIEELSKAKLRMVMATGDNILTAIAVSKECKWIQADSTVYTCDIDKDSNNLEWNLVENYTDVEKFGMISHVEDWQKIVEGGNDHLNMNLNTINEVDEDEDQKSDNNIYKNLSNVDRYNTFTKHYDPETVGEEDYSNDNDNEVDWMNPTARMDNKNVEINDEISLNIDIQKIPQNCWSNDPLNEDYVIAISGPIFESLWKWRNKFVQMRNDKYAVYYNVFKLILKNCYIFARMSPEHKTILVQCLREEKFTVLMCGDGANDCGALKSADVGVSLSTEEASIAAHFSSEVFDISCLIRLFLECKASLVTSIQTFKYMMLYSLIQFISVTILMVCGSYLTDYQFLSSDLIIIFPWAFLISRTEAEDKLTHHIPTGALISVPIISSIIFQTSLMFFFQILGWFVWFNQRWYENYCITTELKVFECFDNSVVFWVSNMQYLISAWAFSISFPFKKSITTNYLLVVCLVIAFGYSIYLIIIPDEYSLKLLDLVDFKDSKFKYEVLFIAVFNFFTCYIGEKALVPFISKKWKKMKYEKLKRKIEDKEEYTLNQWVKIKKLSM